MIKKILPLLITLFYLKTNSISQNKKLPIVKVKDLKGKSIDFQNIENNGDPIVISFWKHGVNHKKELNTLQICMRTAKKKQGETCRCLN